MSRETVDRSIDVRGGGLAATVADDGIEDLQITPAQQWDENEQREISLADVSIKTESGVLFFSLDRAGALAAAEELLAAFGMEVDDA